MAAPTVKRKAPVKAATPTAAATQFDYDAVKTTGRRKAPSTRVRAEHIILPDSKRRKMLATVQDQVRNASIAAWAIRRHIDYVSKFRFQFRTAGPDETPENRARAKLDKLVNLLFHWHAQPDHFDIAGRFGREEMFRMFELEKVTAGDAAMIKLETLHLQAIESDLIALPTCGKWNSSRSVYDDRPPICQQVNKDTGALMDERYPGRVSQWCICNRGHDGSRVAFDHMEPAENVIFDGYFTRFSSQCRGVSPLSTAINTIADVYDGVDYALAKAKLHQLFGIALMRDYAGADDDQQEIDGWGGASGIQTGTDEAKETAAETEAGTKQIATSMQEVKPGEMMMLDMDVKGRIDTIESKTPSTEFKNFTEFAIRLALLALDIPYTAFDSKAASFSGMIADQNLYEVSCKWKREKNLWKRREYSDWLLREAWDGTTGFPLRKIATEAGYTDIRELQMEVEWVPAGFPWLQKIQEVQGDIKAMSVMLDNPIDACKRRGGDFFENVLKMEQATKFAAQHGVTMMIGEPGQQTIGAAGGDGREPENDREDDDE